MVAGPPCRSRAFKAECGKVQFIDEDVDHPDWVLLAGHSRRRSLPEEALGAARNLR